MKAMALMKVDVTPDSARGVADGYRVVGEKNTQQKEIVSCRNN